MLVTESRVVVAGLTGRDDTDFMLAAPTSGTGAGGPASTCSCTPGAAVGRVGDIVEMDELVGRCRLRLRGSSA